MTIKTVALIGAGNMGSRMALCVKRAGFQLTVCDQDQEQEQEQEQRKA